MHYHKGELSKLDTTMRATTLTALLATVVVGVITFDVTSDSKTYLFVRPVSDEAGLPLAFSIQREIRGATPEEEPTTGRIVVADICRRTDCTCYHVEKSWGVWDTLSAIVVSAGAYESMERIIPPASLGEISHVAIALELKWSATIPVWAVGSVLPLERAESIISSSRADLVALGRAQVAHPEIVLKSATGRKADIGKCTGCSECTFRTTGDPQMYCPVNPSLRKGQTT